MISRHAVYSPFSREEYYSMRGLPALNPTSVMMLQKYLIHFVQQANISSADNTVKEMELDMEFRSRILLQNLRALKLDKCFPPERIVNVLSLGCDIGSDLLAIASTFKQFRYCGIDNHAMSLQLCMMGFRELVMGGNVEFRLMDLNTSQFNTPVLRERFDLIIWQHPPIIPELLVSTASDVIPIVSASHARVYISFSRPEEYPVFLEKIRGFYFSGKDIVALKKQMVIQELNNVNLPYHQRTKIRGVPGLMNWQPESIAIVSQAAFYKALPPPQLNIFSLNTLAVAGIASLSMVGIAALYQYLKEKYNH